MTADTISGRFIVSAFTNGTEAAASGVSRCFTRLRLDLAA